MYVNLLEIKMTYNLECMEWIYNYVGRVIVGDPLLDLIHMMKLLRSLLITVPCRSSQQFP
jgi:hypothetical protein